jgi:hypothetical protein
MARPRSDTHPITRRITPAAYRYLVQQETAGVNLSDLIVEAVVYRTMFAKAEEAAKLRDLAEAQDQVDTEEDR